MAPRYLRLVRVYQSLSDNQKNNFWLAVSNIFLVIFTFWLGLTVQYIIVDSNSKLNSKIVSLEYYNNISSNYDKYVQQQNIFINCLFNIPKESDSNLILSQFFNLNNDKFREITNVTDSVTEIANKLKWIIIDGDVAKKLENAIKFATLCNGLLKCCVVNSNIQDRADLINSYFRSDFFIKQTHTVTTPYFRNQVIQIFNEKLATTSNVLICARLLTVSAGYVSEIFNILNTEINPTQHNDVGGVGVMWNEAPTIIKSLIILFFLLIIGFFVANRLLTKMYLPSRNKIYTQEEYNCVTKEKEKIERENQLLKNSLSQDDAICYTLQKHINELNQSIADRDEKYFEVLTELKEKKRRLEELGESNADELSKD